MYNWNTLSTLYTGVDCTMQHERKRVYTQYRYKNSHENWSVHSGHAHTRLTCVVHTQHGQQLPIKSVVYTSKSYSSSSFTQVYTAATYSIKCSSQVYTGPHTVPFWHLWCIPSPSTQIHEPTLLYCTPDRRPLLSLGPLGPCISLHLRSPLILAQYIPEYW